MDLKRTSKRTRVIGIGLFKLPLELTLGNQKAQSGFNINQSHHNLVY